MNIKTQTQTITNFYFKNYIISAEQTDETTDFYIKHKNYCDKIHVIGLQNKDIESTSLYHIIEINLLSWISFYSRNYLDWDEYDEYLNEATTWTE